MFNLQKGASGSSYGPGRTRPGAGEEAVVIGRSGIAAVLGVPGAGAAATGPEVGATTAGDIGEAELGPPLEEG